MNLGRLSSAALFLSGVAGAAMPERIAAALDLAPTSPRGRAEVRAGLGGTYAGLGLFGLLRGGAAQHAVGFTWLGAAAARLAALKADEPRTDWTYWSYLAAEVSLGVAALTPNRRRGTA